MDEDVFGGFDCNLDDLDELDGLGTAAAPARKKVPEQAETKTGVLCQEQGCTLGEPAVGPRHKLQVSALPCIGGPA